MGVWVAAPSAAALLADWGADVIKVEPPSGDPIRGALGSLGIGDRPNPAFAQDNRGKRSIVLDLRQPEAKESLEELLASADVFVTNLRPDALDGLGLEAEATVARHPHLVYCSMSGYGLRGDDRNRPAYDIGAFWARTGLSVQLATNVDGVPLERAWWHRGPRLRPGRAGRHPRRRARAAPDRTRACRRGLVAADRQLHPRMGPEPAGRAGQGGAGGSPRGEPDAVHELVPGPRWSLVLLHGPRGGSSYREDLSGARSRGPAPGSAVRRCPGAAQEPGRGDRGARRDHCGRTARRVGGTIRS